MSKQEEIEIKLLEILDSTKESNVARSRELIKEAIEINQKEE